MAIPINFGELLGKISDQGEKFNKLDSPKCRYYAFLSKIEDVSPKDMPIEDQTWAALFEIVPYEWIESLPEEIWESKSPLPISPASLIETDETKASDFAEALNANVGEIDEGNWYIIEDIEPLEEGSPRPAERVSNGKRIRGKRSRPDGRGKSANTSAGGLAPPPDRRRKLAAKFLPDGALNYTEISNKMGAQVPSAMGVMDVGQASCNLVYNELGNPIFYSDLGVPTPRYRESIPDFANPKLIEPGPGPCLANFPFVILSHWDLDHCLMAECSTNKNDICNLIWLVPRQQIGTEGYNIFRRLNHGHVWPADRTNPLVINNRLKIIKCVGRTINTSGLAVAVKIRLSDRSERWALLPGDATFQFIPGVDDIHYDWITASHHGSDHELKLRNIPEPRENSRGRIAYSYGIMANGDHCYHHPSPVAMDKYKEKGWGTTDDKVSATAQKGPRSPEIPRERGNIMMCHNTHPPDCGTPSCPFHHFKVVLE